MKAPVPVRQETLRKAAPLRGGKLPATPTYDRDHRTQAAFEDAVAKLWAHDSRLNPRTGERELKADLVLEGGGVKGIGLAGAICVLAEAGYRFPRAAGTSAGAIVAVLVAALEKSGQNMTGLRNLLSDIDYNRFTDSAPARPAFERLIHEVADVVEFMLRGGLYTGDYLESWLGPVLAGFGVSTWADLALHQADDPGMSLQPWQRYRAVVHTSDITRGMLTRLPWDYQNFYGLPADDQPVVAAVRASMSIPFFFAPVRLTTRRARTKLPGGRFIDWPGGTVTCVDGGMLMNFPINAFDRADGAPPRWPTIGIKLSGAPRIQIADSPARNAPEEAYRCLKTMTSEWDQYHVDQETADRTIFVRNDGIAATQFDLTPAQQTALFRNGARAATNFVIKWAQAGGVPRGAVVQTPVAAS
ncbi:MAG: patatin-like phospholipase family protein [Streptosporangiaceae bacterium]